MSLPPHEPPRPPTIEELMNRLADGDDGVLGPLFDLVAPIVRRYLERRIGADRIDSAMQTIMLELHRGRSTYLPGADVLTWAFSFAQFLVKDAGTSTSTLDDDVIDLVKSGLHAKQVATVLDISTTKVRASCENYRQRLETVLLAGLAKEGGAPRLRPVAPSPSELVGTVIDCYRIEAHIGSGGFGNVYRATRIGVGGDVAIKVMREIPETDRRAVERFKSEARLMVEIGAHPNIVRVHADGDLPDGRAWYAMTLLSGKPLDRIVGHDEPLPWPRVARLVRQLCSALAVVHRHDIVHGDVKPANCFLTDGGHENEALRLLDFGLAKRAAGTEAHRAIAPLGAVDGTAQYVAPELLQGRAADRRADIYAIGVMMFEMLTGRTPFVAEGFAALVVAKTILPTPTLAARSGLQFPRGIESIVRRAMHQDPAQRFDSVEALAAAIAALGPSGRRSAPLWSIGRDARVRLALTASISALAASLVTAAILAKSPGRLPLVPKLERDHVSPVIEAERPRIDACRTDASPGPDRAKLKVLGETGEVIEVIEPAASPSSDCVRDVLHHLRFPRFDAGQTEIEVDL